MQQQSNSENQRRDTRLGQVTCNSSAAQNAPVGNSQSPALQRMWLSIEEFEAMSGLSASTINRRIKSGALKAVQPGGKGSKWLIASDSLEQLSTKNEAAVSATKPDEDLSRSLVIEPNQPSHSTQQIPPTRRGPRPMWKQRVDNTKHNGDMTNAETP